MKELTEEMPEQKGGVKFESMNVTTGDIFPKEKNTLKFPHKIVKIIILFIIITLILIGIIIFFQRFLILNVKQEKMINAYYVINIKIDSQNAIQDLN